MKNNYFHYYITNFFTEFLPNQRGYSKNTIISYKYTFILLIQFIKEKYQMNINKILIEDINKDIIIDFINYLTNEKGNSISTTNLRLCALHTFYKYLMQKDISYLTLSSDILNLKTKKGIQKEIYYLTKEETKKLFDVFDINSLKDLRAYSIIALLYDSGARVQELIDLSPNSINFDNSTITLHGKGNKTRVLPISEEVIKLIRFYVKKYGINKNYPLLFFNSRKEKLTREGIKYILKKYAKKANLNYKKLSPHKIRHSKAMHLLENDLNIVYIRDFLGHKSVTTTEIYAKANPKVKKEAIEKLSTELVNEKKYTINEENELLSWLKKSV